MTTKEIKDMKTEDMWLLVIIVFVLVFTASFGQGIFG
jgi:hypothetical protein